MLGNSAEGTIEDRLTIALGQDYQVRGSVGKGGFAEVFEIWDRNLERRLAAKVLSPEIASSPGTRERFTHEARTVARLTHPAILPIHFVGTAQDLAYYVMPFVEGVSLRERINQQKKLTPAQVVDIAVPVLAALQHAHDAGLVHRDIKPDNVMLETKTNRALLVDFGIAKALDPTKASNVTQTGFAVGTPHFMSPEQALGGELDGRSDLYSFGAMLFEAVTGEKPFDGDTTQEIIGQHLGDQVREPVHIDEHIPLWLSDAIVKCLEKHPDDRFQTAADALQALESPSTPLGGSALKTEPEEGGVVVRGSAWDIDVAVWANDAPPEPPKTTVYDVSTPVVDQDPFDQAWLPTTEHETPAEAPSDAQEPAEEVPDSLGIEHAPDVTRAEPIAAQPDAPSPAAQPDAPPPAAQPDAPPPAAQKKTPIPPPRPTPAAAAPPSEPPVAEVPVEEEAVPSRVVPRRASPYTNPRPRKGRGRALALLPVIALVGAAGFWLTKGGGASQLGGLTSVLPGGGAQATDPNSPAFQFVSNSLVFPVEILRGDEVLSTIQPGQRDSLPLKSAADIRWRLVRPSDNNREMGANASVPIQQGVEMDGSWYATVSARSGEQALFAPRINNRTSRDVMVVINPGTRSEIACNCRIDIGVVGKHIGYYPLLQNSVVRFYDARRGTRGPFRDVTVFRDRIETFPGTITISVPDF